MTSAEFYGAAGPYTENGDYLLARVDDVGAVPSKDDLIRIGQKTWRVTEVTWCVDNVDTPGYTTALRANINLEKF